MIQYLFFRFLQRVSSRLGWTGHGSSRKLQLHNLVQVSFDLINIARFLLIVVIILIIAIIIVIVKVISAINFFVNTRQSCLILRHEIEKGQMRATSKSDQLLKSWSFRGTFGLWGNILSGSPRLLPKHFLPNPVARPLDLKYQVWISEIIMSMRVCCW